MIYIKDIGVYLPETIVSNYDRRDLFNIDDKFIQKLGVEQITKKAPTEETSDLCVKAFNNLTVQSEIDIEAIDCVVVCTQNPDGNGIPHTSAIVQAKIDASDNCACFDISLGCSGYVYGLSIITSFMESNGLKEGLFFTADPYSTIIDWNDKNTALLFGDAATVTYLSVKNNNEKKFYCEKFCFNTDGRAWSALHNRHGHLEMDGRAIFKLAVVQAPAQINRLLEQTKLSDSEIDIFLFHQGSKYLIDSLRKALKLELKKVPVKLAEHGNTVSSSIPIMLAEYLYLDEINKIILSGFGVGLSWASCLISKK